MPTVNLSFPDQSYSLSNKPSITTLKSDLTTLQEAINALTDVNIATAAAIQYSKLNLTNSILNTDINSAADIAISKTALGTYVTPTAFNPSWTAAGSAPAIGNGTLSGSYVQIGKMVFATIYLFFGSTTTSGSGAWFFGLPMNARSAYSLAGNCMAYGNDTGVNTYTAIGTLEDATKIVIPNSGGGNQWSAGVPHSWGSGDFLRISIAYIVD